MEGWKDWQSFNFNDIKCDLFIHPLLETSIEMRIIAIPIARARVGASPVSTFLAQKTPIKPSFTANRPPTTATPTTTKDASSPSTSSSTSSPSTQKKEPISKRILTKASEFWIDLGREDQKSTFDWKRRTYTLGEKLMDRIEYEEWALKGVDPAMGPTLRSPIKNSEEVESKKEEEMTKVSNNTKLKTVSLLYPPSLLSSNTLLNSLTVLTSSRQPHHRQRMIWCVLGMPLTIPFIVVPIIPNLPFFYLVWRAWSHWRAFQSSKYLSELIQQGRLIPTPSEELDQILASKSPVPADKPPPSPSEKENPSSEIDEQSKVSKEELDSMMVLQSFQIKKLTEIFHLDRQASVDLHRARQQTVKAIKSGEMAKLEEAAKHGAGHDKKDQ